MRPIDDSPTVLFQFDEFGRFLRTIGDPKRAPHLFNVLTALMKLYSSADTRPGTQSQSRIESGRRVFGDFWRWAARSGVSPAILYFQHILTICSNHDILLVKSSTSRAGDAR
jgi:hypothetical protein